MRAALLLLPLLAACAPMSLPDAERECYRDARLAQGPSGEVRIGAATGASGTRPVGGVSVDISSDYLLGRDPEQVWRNCVVRRSGQFPTRDFGSVPPDTMPRPPGRFF